MKWKGGNKLEVTRNGKETKNEMIPKIHVSRFGLKTIYYKLNCQRPNQNCVKGERAKTDHCQILPLVTCKHTYTIQKKCCEILFQAKHYKST